MTQKDFGEYYHNLTTGQKGLFTAYLSMNLGGSPHSWQQKLIGWSKGKIQGRPMAPIISKELTNIITNNIWLSK